MSVTGPSTTLQAILNQIQAPPVRPAGAAKAPDPAASTQASANRPAAGPVTRAPATDVTQNGAAELNPNAPRGTYINIVV